MTKIKKVSAILLSILLVVSALPFYAAADLNIELTPENIGGMNTWCDGWLLEITFDKFEDIRIGSGSFFTVDGPDIYTNVSASDRISIDIFEDDGLPCGKYKLLLEDVVAEGSEGCYTADILELTCTVNPGYSIDISFEAETPLFTTSCSGYTVTLTVTNYTSIAETENTAYTLTTTGNEPTAVTGTVSGNQISFDISDFSQQYGPATINTNGLDFFGGRCGDNLMKNLSGVIYINKNNTVTADYYRPFAQAGTQNDPYIVDAEVVPFLPDFFEVLFYSDVMSYFMLGCDIDNVSAPFGRYLQNVVFDGNGHKITFNSSGGFYYLFDSIFDNAVVKNLITDGSKVQAAIADSNSGLIYNCLNYADFSTSMVNRNYGRIVNCCNFGRMLGTGGGIVYVGESCNGCITENCFAACDPGTNTDVGGIFYTEYRFNGSATGVINHCFYDSDLMGDKLISVESSVFSVTNSYGLSTYECKNILLNELNAYAANSDIEDLAEWIAGPDGYPTLNIITKNLSEEHEFSADWSCDADAHWHECTAEDCSIEDYAACGIEGAAYGLHIDENNDFYCDICNYYYEDAALAAAKTEAIATVNGLIANPSAAMQALLDNACDDIELAESIEEVNAVVEAVKAEILVRKEKDSLISDIHSYLNSPYESVREAAEEAVEAIEACTTVSQVKNERGCVKTLQLLTAREDAYIELNALVDEYSSDAVKAIVESAISDVNTLNTKAKINSRVKAAKAAVEAQIQAEADAAALAEAKEAAEEWFRKPLNTLSLGYYSSELVAELIAGLDDLTSPDEVEQYKADSVSAIIDAREEAFGENAYLAAVNEIKDLADALGFDEDEINDILADFDEFLEGDYEGKTAAEVFEALAAGFNDAADEDAMTAVSEKLCFNMILFFNSDWASAADAAEADMNSSLIQAMMIFEDNAKLAEYIEEGAYPVVGIRVLECYPDYVQDFSRCAFDDVGNAFDTAYAARLGDIMDAKAAAEYEAEALEAAKAEAIAAIQNAATDDAYVEVIANLAIDKITAADTLEKVETEKQKALDIISKIVDDYTFTLSDNEVFVAMSGTKTITAAFPEGISGKTVTWSSTNPDIATVNEFGVVTGVAAGITMIKATADNGFVAYCAVKVVGIEAVSGAKLNHNNGYITGLSAKADSLDDYITVTDDSCELSYDSYATSSILYLTRNGEIVDAYTLVVTGDVNGDGVCDVLDAALCEQASNEHTELEGAFFAAGDLNESDAIDVNDYAAVVNAALA